MAVPAVAVVTALSPGLAQADSSVGSQGNPYNAQNGFVQPGYYTDFSQGNAAGVPNATDVVYLVAPGTQGPAPMPSQQPVQVPAQPQNTSQDPSAAAQQNQDPTATASQVTTTTPATTQVQPSAPATSQGSSQSNAESPDGSKNNPYDAQKGFVGVGYYTDFSKGNSAGVQNPTDVAYLIAPGKQGPLPASQFAQATGSKGNPYDAQKGFLGMGWYTNFSPNNNAGVPDSTAVVYLVAPGKQPYDAQQGFVGEGWYTNFSQNNSAGVQNPTDVAYLIAPGKQGTPSTSQSNAPGSAATVRPITIKTGVGTLTTMTKAEGQTTAQKADPAQGVTTTTSTTTGTSTQQTTTTVNQDTTGSAQPINVTQVVGTATGVNQGVGFADEVTRIIASVDGDPVMGQLESVLSRINTGAAVLTQDIPTLVGKVGDVALAPVGVDTSLLGVAISAWVSTFEATQPKPANKTVVEDPKPSSTSAPESNSKSLGFSNLKR
ncbi:MAG: hypothetical protein KGH69_02845 [Candidatus Micrarchaeota archaeon]|nr:hypothetical protein [Candidatus Micrarchaeota archaeon]